MEGTRRREPVVATHGCRFQMRRDREGDGWRFRLANHEPAFGFGVFKHDVAPGVPRKRVSEGLDVTRDRRTEFLDQSPTVNADEVSLSAASSSRARTASRSRSSSTSRLIQSATITPVLTSTAFQADPSPPLAHRER